MSGEWLSLGPASRLLGVDPDTLRRWADSGRIEAYSTPGGHRRFGRRSLDRLIAERPAGQRLPLARLGATPERLSAVYRRTYGAAPSRSGMDVRQAVPDTERGAFRRDGRQLVAAVLRNLDAADDRERQTAEQEALGIAGDLAARLASSGTSLTESVGLFVAARRPFLAEIGGLGRRRGLSSTQLGVLFEAAAALLDRLLLGFISAHQAAAAGTTQ
jgi:excisionase family DNA binding protein